MDARVRLFIVGAVGFAAINCPKAAFAQAISLANPGFDTVVTAPQGGFDFEATHYDVGSPIPDHVYVPGVGVNGAMGEAHTGAALNATGLASGYVGSPESNAGILRDTRDFTTGPTGPGAFLTIDGPAAAIYQVNSGPLYLPNTAYVFSVDVFDRNAAIGIGGADVVSFPTTVEASLMSDLTEVTGEVQTFVAPPNGGRSVLTLTYTTGATPPTGNIGFVLRASGRPSDPLSVTQVVFDNAAMSIVPEPSTLSLIALGGLAALPRRRAR